MTTRAKLHEPTGEPPARTMEDTAGAAADARRSPAASAASHVYHEVKARILNNQLHPGNKLTHQGIADLLQVSRTPVREALERLCQEGFAVHRPRRGYFVAEISAKEARELHEVRDALEVFALRQATAGDAVTIDLARLAEINARYRQAVEDGQNKLRMLVDREFHLTLAQHAGNDYVIRILNGIFEQLILKLRVDGYSTDRGLAAWREHEALLEALDRADFDKAAVLLSHHVRAAHRRLLEQIERSPLLMCPDADGRT